MPRNQRAKLNIQSHDRRMSSETTLWDKFTKFMGGSVLSSVVEIQRLIPDSILFGTLLMYILTSNVSFGVFGVFIFELMGSHKLISWLFSQTTGDSRPNIPIQCRVGYRTPQFDPKRILSVYNFPSEGIFSVTSMGTYLGMAMREFKDTLATMGAEWDSRYSLSLAFILLFILMFIITTYMHNCDNGLGEVAIASILGIIAGLIFFYVNKAVFGKESMNFLGLPFLVEKDKTGSPIYVCAAEKHNA